MARTSQRNNTTEGPSAEPKVARTTQPNNKTGLPSAEPKVARTTQPNNKTGLPSAEPKVGNEKRNASSDQGDEQSGHLPASCFPLPPSPSTLTNMVQELR